MTNDQTLPERPSLEHLKNQARERQRSTPGLTLTEAQRDLARSYGFSSWNRLRQHVESLRSREKALERWVEAALGGRREEAEAIEANDPGLREEPVVRVMRGETVEADPRSPFAPRGWPLILYACFSRIAETAPSAESLLARGADANAYWIHPEWPDPPQTCLAGAVAVRNDPELTRILLAHGANPTDGEGLYHGAEHRDLRCLRLLYEAGAKPQGFNALARMLDFEDPEGLRLVLSHWGGPDDEMHTGLHHALERGRSAAIVGILLEHGADRRFRRHGADLGTAALILGRPDVAALASAEPGEPDMQAMVDAAQGRPVVAPDVWSPNAEWFFVRMAGRNLVEPMRALIRAGIPLDSRGEGGRRPLHEAAFAGAAEAVEVLLEAGADLTIGDDIYRGTPLNFCAAGVGFWPNPHGDYPRVAEALLNAGAAAHCSPEWVVEQSRSNPGVTAVLQRFGLK